LGKRVLAKAIYYKNYYKTSSLIIRYLGAFAVGEATASVRRTQLAVVSAQTASSPVNGTVTKLGQLTREERYPISLFNLIGETSQI
jgi:hypothetical protein